MHRVLVTDAEQRSSLAVVRSLGRAGHQVVVCSQEARPLAGASRHARSTHRVPDPATDADGFIRSVAHLVEAEFIGIVLPMTDVSAPLLLPLRASRPDLVIPFPPADSYENASDKRLLMSAAAEVGVPVPRQAVMMHRNSPFPEGLPFPLVLKPSRSAVREGNSIRKVGVSIVGSRDELDDRLARYADVAYPILLQERIVGPGLGAFMLCREGATIAAFGHRRLREKPPTGGVSVYRESVALREDVKQYAERLLAHFAWSGVAMVEFKEDAVSGIPYLMEINGRFWGSLQLAIDAGVDFPELLVRSAMGEVVESVDGYRCGIRSRWFWGDVDHLIGVLRAPKGYRAADPELPSKLGALARFAVPWRPGDRFEVLEASDPGPFLRESSQWLGSLVRGRSRIERG